MTYYIKSADRLEVILAEMAAEGPEARRTRWQGWLDREAGVRAERLVLFGAGAMGQWTLQRLRQAGVEPCCFADNQAQLWGTSVDGLEVLCPAGAAQRFGHDACFVVTIFNGSPARQQLRQLNCTTVVPAAVLFWKYHAQLTPESGLDTPERLVEEVAAIRQCFAILSDEASRHELCSQVEWRYWMSPESLACPAEQGHVYFPADLITEDPEEVFVDGGAFDGDSVRSFLQEPKSFRHVYALEPDTSNYARLCVSVEHLPAHVQSRITAWPYALGDKNRQVSFVEAHDQSSKVSADKRGIAVDSRTLDSLPWEAKPTYIKLDIEGYEPLAIAGAADLLRSEMPVLAICVYHRSQHLWQIPNLIHSIAPGYAFFLRRYAEDNWEEVCYAVPPGRLKQQHEVRQ